MRCGCKSRGNANLYLCVLVPERQFPCLQHFYYWHSILLIVVLLLLLLLLLLLVFVVVLFSLVLFAVRPFNSLHSYQVPHNTRSCVTVTSTEREKKNKTMYLFVAFLCKIPRLYSRQKQFFWVTQAENI